MPSATQMAAAKLCPWMTAATEHSPEVPLLQSTGMSANVVFERTWDVVKLEDFQRASDEETAAVPQADASHPRTVRGRENR